MIVKIDGEEYEIPDETVRAHIEMLDAEDDDEVVPSNKYIFGVHVHHTKELSRIGDDIKRFTEKLGIGAIEVQVSVNAKLAEHKDMVVGFKPDAIGYVQESDDDDYWDDDYDEEEGY